ncbi:MAG: hypothetical protein ACTS73_07390 [Arsenophonus sp. NEOnobi-MAG3]
MVLNRSLIATAVWQASLEAMPIYPLQVLPNSYLYSEAYRLLLAMLRLNCLMSMGRNAAAREYASTARCYQVI